MNRTSAYATNAGIAMPKQPSAPAREHCADRTAPVVRDLRDRAGRSPHALLFGAGDLVVITGLPGSGKSTLMHRAVTGHRIDSQDTRDRWDARVPRRLPYALYRPLVRLAHYAGLRRALRTGEGIVVHDCGTQAWVRAWLAREARRRGGTLHLLLLDVHPETARQGQRERGRGVSRYAFSRHRRATDRLLRAVEKGELPAGCGSAVLLDRDAAGVLSRVGFTR
ncbi:AAA family ATPase [Streptomyces actinomycinicus]|uniref:AAA family ATPase n=1 Tax=Streptomyces actinomycinicus TaxID=1695166 RepID=A0A937ENN7_9ACTN|nr:AAA family ATPase [Streptomyces actinomycinicus]MBL1086673.1 AAA family ATPase [Streptomyces actinomycinicus]